MQLPQNEVELTRLLHEAFVEGAASREAELAELRRYKPLQSMVVVSRKWDERQIRVQYMNDSIRIDMPARDFVLSVLRAAEDQKKTRPWYRRLWQRLDLPAAMEAVEHEMKLATIHEPPPLQR